jgi:preprotein translocase SecE subunit
VAIQNNGNEEERVEGAISVAEAVEGATDTSGQPKRRGRAARRRRRAEVQTALTETDEMAEAEVELKAPRKEAPTPSRRQKERTSNIITRALSPATSYFRETLVELRKVAWPTRRESTRLSGIVLGLTLVSAIVLGLYNYLLNIGFDLLLRLIPK